MLQAIRLVDCQSFEDATLEFSTDRVNILVAENNTGKSILFKMLKVTVNPNGLPNVKRNQLIRRGAKCASMICAFTDGSIGITQVYKNTVIYRFKDADSDNFYTYNEPPDKYIKALGLVVDKRTKFIANIIDTEQDMLLVNSDQKGNNELLRLLAESTELLDLRDKLTIEYNNCKRYGSDLLIKESALKQSIDTLQYGDVEKLEYEYNRSSAIYKSLSLLVNASETVENIFADNMNSYNYGKAITMIDLLIELDNIDRTFSEITTQQPISEDGLKLLGVIDAINNALNDVMVLPKIDMNNEFVQLLIDIQSMCDFISVTHDNSIAITRVDEMKLLNSALASVINVNRLREELTSIESDCARVINQMTIAGKQVNCPIHGKVVYDGKECVPYNLGFA